MGGVLTRGSRCFIKYVMGMRRLARRDDLSLILFAFSFFGGARDKRKEGRKEGRKADRRPRNCLVPACSASD